MMFPVIKLLEAKCIDNAEKNIFKGVSFAFSVYSIERCVCI